MGFAGPNVTTGWNEFLGRLGRLANRGQRNYEAGWATFEKLVQSSPRQETLAIFLRLGRELPERERYRLAVGVTRLLAPIEWPQEWEAVRPTLADAISRLASEMDPDEENSFFAQIATRKGAEPRRMAYLAMASAEDLLRKPRRDQLRTIAMLCNAGMAVCIETHRQCSKTMNSSNLHSFGAAIADYATAAGLLNEAAGAVLFEGLHAALEEE